MHTEPIEPLEDAGLIVRPSTDLMILPDGGSSALSEIISRSLAHIQSRRAPEAPIRRAGEEQEFEIAHGVKIVMCWIPPGDFLMGSPHDELGRFSVETQHRVTITQGYWLGKYQVNQAQWAAVILLLDDIAVYKSGGDSLIGDLINSFKDLPDLAKILMGAGGALALGGVIKNIGLLGGALRGLAGLATILSPITAFFTAAIAFAAMSPKIGKSIAEKMDKTTTGQAIGDFLLDAKIGIGKILEYGGNNSPLLAGGSSQMSTIINNNNNNINISGVPEPQAVGREVSNALENAQAKQGNNLR